MAASLLACLLLISPVGASKAWASQSPCGAGGWFGVGCGSETPGGGSGGGGSDSGGGDSGGGSGTPANPGDSEDECETTPVNNPETGQVEWQDCNGVPAEINGPPPEGVEYPWISEEEFQSYDIPPSVIRMSPEGWGVTRNKTAFYAESGVRTIDMTILGFAVTVKATPVAYEWDFGDGQTLRTRSPGEPPVEGQEPSLYHVYGEKGAYEINLTTVYTGMFQVDGGPWLVIEGQAAVASDPVDADIYRYHRYLVDQSCDEDPTGPDC